MFKKLLAGATLLCAASVVNAATVSYDVDVAVSTTNFETTVSLPEFDDMGGSLLLESVTFSIDGVVEGSVSAESLDAAPATLETTLEATLTLTDALSNVLVVTIPTVTNVDSVSAFDGTIDFAGTSGVSYSDISATQFNSESYTDAATLAFFTGTGTQDFSFDAEATSSATGAGNIATLFESAAGGLVTVTYVYSEVVTNVSAPSHLALLGLGLVAFAGFRKVRK